MQLFSYSFDGFVSNFYPALLSGGRVVLPPGEGELDIDFIAAIIRDEKVTNITLVPGMYRVLLEGLEAEDMKHLRFVVLAGEAAPPSLIRESQEKNPGLRLINEYGPTETTVGVTAHMEMNPSNPSIIGFPIANTSIYILDNQMNPLPVGVAGECCISGAGVSRGYLNNPELTAERFITSDELSIINLYKTGDLARWLVDRSLEFLGRIDRQVKVRGYRIEPGEIEARLLGHDEVAQAVVVQRKDRGRAVSLCAYVVAGVGEAELKDYLALELPDYMIPGQVAVLEKMPLTSSGKVDWDALPVPGMERLGELTAPRNETEQRLAGIWESVLNVEPGVIGIESSFFGLGGDSLKAALLVSRVHKVFGVRLPVTELFNAPVLKDMAAGIAAMGATSFVPLEKTEDKEYYPLSFNQKRLWIIHLLAPDSCAYHISGRVSLEHPGDLDSIRRVLYRIVSRHESFRTAFRTIGDEPVQVVSPGVVVPLETFDLSTLTEEEKEWKSGEYYHRLIGTPFDLEQAPLFRVCLVKLSPLDCRLLFCMHHIISDGWSMELLKREFKQYLEHGEGVAWEPLKLQYRDFAQWQNRAEQQTLKETQGQYWLDVFSGQLPLLELPADYKRPAFQRFDGAAVKFFIPLEETGSMAGILEESGATRYMYLLAVFTILLSKLGGQEDIVVGTPVAARGHEDLENIIGMFVNTFALRNFPVGETTFHA
ncbi:MAG: AMP-binding protein, partial [bacterium]|nr:AMP-binding protein [bacterium]